jgi:SsrA-binding protein
MAKQGTKKQSVEPRSIQNRKARHDFEISDTYEAGIALVGTEVKSLYLGRAHLADAFCRVKNGELWIMNMDVEPYEQASFSQHDRRRDRKLLLHRKEIDTLERKALEKGFTMVPLSAYFKAGRVKVLIGLGRGRSNYDKREKIAQQDTRRESERLRAGKAD